MIRRKLKNAVNNYTEAEIKVREATSNDPWGPSSTLMSEIADLTNGHATFTEIMGMIWRRLNDKNKNWRHVYKALLLMEYIIKTGSPRVAQQCKENVHAIQTLRDFQYTEDGKDHGLSVREKAKALVSLLRDDDLLKVERERALIAKQRFSSNATGMGSHTAVKYGRGAGMSQGPSLGNLTERTSERNTEDDLNCRPEIAAARPRSAGEEEIQLAIALAMSKEEHDEQEKRKEQENQKEDFKVWLAMEHSKKEDEILAPLRPPPRPAEQHQRRMAAKDDFYDTIEGDIKGTMSSGPNTDPWGTPSAQVNGAVTQSKDPWSPFPAAPVASQSGPWEGDLVSRPPAGRDPWGSESVSPPPPPLPVRSASAGDPWASPPSVSKSNGTAAFAFAPSDDFQALASRPGGAAADLDGVWSTDNPMTADNDIYGAVWNVEPLSADRPTATSAHASPPSSGTGMFDLMNIQCSTRPMMSGSMSADDLLGSGADHRRGSKKNPRDFLGENASLVNLDNLVTKPAEPPQQAGTVFSSTNPFATSVPRSTPNPFAALQQPKVPMSQLAAQSKGGFGEAQTTTSSTMVPPLFPYGGLEPQPQPMMAYPPANNPWLQPQQQQPPGYGQSATFNPFM